MTVGALYREIPGGSWVAWHDADPSIGGCGERSHPLPDQAAAKRWVERHRCPAPTPPAETAVAELPTVPTGRPLPRQCDHCHLLVKLSDDVINPTGVRGHPDCVPHPHKSTWPQFRPLPDGTHDGTPEGRLVAAAALCELAEWELESAAWGRREAVAFALGAEVPRGRVAELVGRPVAAVGRMADEWAALVEQRASAGAPVVAEEAS